MENIHVVSTWNQLKINIRSKENSKCIFNLRASPKIYSEKGF